MSRERGANKRQGSFAPRFFWLLMSCGIFAALAGFESEVIRERNLTGSQAARTRGRNYGRKLALMKARVRTVQAAMADCDMPVPELCKELGFRPATLSSTMGPEDSPGHARSGLSTAPCKRYPPD